MLGSAWEGASREGNAHRCTMDMGRVREGRAVDGLVVIEVCANNRLAPEWLSEIEQRLPGAAVLETDCTNTCGLCQVRAFAYVNGKLVHDPDPAKCVEKIEDEARALLRWLTSSEDEKGAP